MTRYANWDEVLDYCVYSANPVGRLVLYLCGYSDAERQRLSDATCTALQLANFWQDVTVDQLKDRVYLPLDLLARHNYTVEELFAHKFDERFRGIMREAVDRARGLFLTGLPLAGMVNRRLAVDLELFSRGGMQHSRQDRAAELRRAVAASEDLEGRTRRTAARAHWRAVALPICRMSALEKSYAHCRAVAKKRARNFYYSFVLLPEEKKNAMCAMYAFMRYCDDLSDEPGANRAAMERWRDALTEALAGRPDSNPTWPAFLDAVERYTIPRDYFHEMIEGVASDLDTRRIQTFDELYRVLLSRGVGGGADDDPHFRIYVARCAAAGGEMRHRVSADEYPARYARRRVNGAHLSARRGSGALRGIGGGPDRGAADRKDSDA